MIDIGDTVKHVPTGETWLVAAVIDSRLYWYGYPFGGYADLSDCLLWEKANKKKRLRIIKDVADSYGDNAPQRHCRHILAQEQK